MPEVMKTVGRYEILREVGRGGMAMVYLARQTDLDRFVALKELGAFHASDPSFAQRFLRESRVAGSLSHPNIVTVHDYFEHDGTPYIAMEYIERGSLRPYVGRMTLAQIGGVLEGLLAGLTHAETHDIVHRDLKPENLMVTADGRVKIADFGIAKATTKMQTGAFLTATGTTVGTPTYMAPEQAMAQDIGPWTDLYSVGCMAFELFTGKVPFHDSDAPMAILLRHVNEPIAPVKSIRPEVDQRISDWIERLLVKEPEQRTRNAQDAWDDFEEILLGLLGPRWRREARLVERRTDSNGGAKPLTPAPFHGTSVGGEPSEEFKSFAWGAPAGDTGGSPTAPPMWTPPPSQSAPALPEPVVGPPTPMPSQAVPAPPTDGETGFVTFGVPAPALPSDALIPAAEPQTATSDPQALAGSTAPSEAPAGPTAPGDALAGAPAGVDPSPTFETYVEPPPSQPPAAEPVVTPRPAEAVTPAPGPVVDPLPSAAAETMMPQTAPPAAPPKAPREKAAGGRPGWLLPAGIVGAVAVIGVGAALALSSGDDSPPAATASPAPTEAPAVPISAQGLAFEVPAGWSDGGATARVSGFEDGAVTARGPDGGTIVAGKADETAADATLLPEALRGSDTPEKQIVNLGEGVQAAKYAELPIGAQTGTVFAVPTDKGVVALACIAAAETCDKVASSVKITDGTAFPVGPSEAYQGDVEGILGKLEKSERSAAADLRNAGRRATQVTATSRLAKAYSGAAAALAKLDVSPADERLNDQLAGSLRGAANAYKNATSEGRAKDRNGFKRQGSAAVAAGKDVDAALDGLKAAGYDLRSTVVNRAAATTKLPALIKDKPKPRPRAASNPVPRDTTPRQQPRQPATPQPPTPRRQVVPQPQPQRPNPAPKPPTGGGGGGGGEGLSGGGEG